MMHDRFSLGVLLYLMLMEGNHPYKGTGEPPEVEERIRLGLFPFQARPPKGVSPARLAPEFGILPGPVQELFRRCFGRERVARSYHQGSPRPTRNGGRCLASAAGNSPRSERRAAAFRSGRAGREPAG